MMLIKIRPVLKLASDAKHELVSMVHTDIEGTQNSPHQSQEEMQDSLEEADRYLMT